MLPRAPVSNWIDPRDIKASMGESIDLTTSNWVNYINSVLDQSITFLSFTETPSQSVSYRVQFQVSSYDFQLSFEINLSILVVYLCFIDVHCSDKTVDQAPTNNQEQPSVSHPMTPVNVG